MHVAVNTLRVVLIVIVSRVLERPIRGISSGAARVSNSKGIEGGIRLNSTYVPKSKVLAPDPRTVSEPTP